MTARAAFGKPFADVDAGDLRRLVDGRVEESRTLEFKRSEPDSQQLVKVAASFANTDGGVLVLGIREEEGAAVEITGLKGDPDNAALRVQDILRSNITPQIRSMESRIVRVDDKAVLLLEVRRSWLRPHMCLRHQRFVRRGDRGTVEMDRDEIRDAFLEEVGVRDRIARLAERHRARVLRGLTDIPTSSLPVLMVHVAAREGLEDQRLIDHETAQRLVSDHVVDQRDQVLGFHGYARLNLEGAVCSGHSDGSSPRPNTGCCQLNVTGSLEFATCESLSGERTEQFGPLLFGNNAERFAVKWVEAARRVFAEMDLNPPFYVTISLARVEGFALGSPSHFTNWGVFDRENVELGTTVMTDWETPALQALHDTLNLMWCATGRAHSPYITPDHQWEPTR